MSDRRLRVAIVGVGNCASSLVQGVRFYRDAPDHESVPGLMNVRLGGYHIGDIEFSAAFDVASAKVDRDLADVIFAPPNNTIRFADPPNFGVRVCRGPTLDGLGKYLRDVVAESDEKPVDVARVLKETKTDVVVSYLPVGSEQATKW